MVIFNQIDQHKQVHKTFIRLPVTLSHKVFVYNLELRRKLPYIWKCT